MKRLIFCAVLVLASLLPGISQAGLVADPDTRSERKLSVTTLNYVVSFPTAATRDFMGSTVSFRGLGFEWTSAIGESDLHWGLSLRWLYFKDVVENGSFTQGATTATGRLFRAVDSFPIAVHVKYPLASFGRVVTFVGLGAGTTYGARELQIGALSQNEYGWQFLLAPEVGALFTPAGNKAVGIYFNARYDGGFGTSVIGAITNLSLALGIGSTF